jgi:hypothetical protein
MGTGIRSRSPPMSKFCNDLCVCAPQSLSKTERNSPHSQINPMGCDCDTSRSKYKRRDASHEGESKLPRELRGGRNRALLVIGDLDRPTGVALLRKPVEIGRVSAGWRRSSAATDSDGEPVAPARHRQWITADGGGGVQGSSLGIGGFVVSDHKEGAALVVGGGEVTGAPPRLQVDSGRRAGLVGQCGDRASGWRDRARGLARRKNGGCAEARGGAGGRAGARRKNAGRAL